MKRMPQTLVSLRISVPETIYGQLEEPANPDLQLALDGLSHLFGVRHSGSHPSYESVAWSAISDAMIEDPSGITLPEFRPEPETAKRVFGLIQEYPWLRKISDASSRLDTIMEREFFGMFLDHTVDDYPGLFGITLREAKILRARSQEVGYDLYGLAEQAGLYEQPAFK